MLAGGVSVHVRFKRSSALTIWTLVLGLGFASPGRAQTDDADIRGIDEIVVTAQKRDSTLQETALSLTHPGFGPDALINYQVL